MTIRDFIDIVEGHRPTVGYHVTDRAAAEEILRDGFYGDWGDVGFGVYFWMGRERAEAYAKKGGWDGRLNDPVILQVQDPDLQPIDPSDVHPDWDADLYAAMLWKPMDADNEDNPWRPQRMTVLP